MNHHSIHKLLILFAIFGLLLSGTEICYSQDNVKFETYTTENGLSNNVIYSTFQDSKGYLWVGTNDGLNRYDGYTFKTFRNNPSDSNSIIGDRINTISEDADGDIWVGSNGGLCRYNYNTGNFTRCFSSKEVWLIILLNENELFIRVGLQFNNQEYFVINTRTLKSYPVGIFQKGEEPGFNYGLLARDAKGNIYLSQKPGLTTLCKIWRYDPERKYFFEQSAFRLSTSTTQQGINYFFIDSRQHYWLGTGNGLTTNGISLYEDPAGNSTEKNGRLLFEKKDLGAVMNMCEDRTGNIWISATTGLYYYDYEKNSLAHYPAGPQGNSPSSDIVRNVCLDKTGNIWIGTFKGLIKSNSPVKKFRNISTAKLTTPAPCNPSVMGLYKEGKDLLRIHYLFCTLHYSLLDLLTGAIHHYPFDQGDLLKIGLKNAAQLHDTTNKHLAPLVNKPFIRQSIMTNTMVVDDEQNVWIFVGPNFQNVNTGNKWNFDFNIEDMQPLDNEIWLATDGGLACFDKHKEKIISMHSANPADTTSISSNNVTCFIIDLNGNMWVGTRGGGLNYFDRKKNIFYHYTEKTGLCNNDIYCMVKDDSGSIWLGTSGGLSCFDPATQQFRNYSGSDGLINAEYNRFSALKLDNGMIYIGGMNGIDYFDPRDLKADEKKPIIQITDFRVFNKSIYPGGDHSLQHDENYVSIHFAIMDFDDPSRNKYLFRLEGIDKDWVDGENRNYANYSNLAPGHYRFLVKGSNSNGNWSEPASIEFSISTPWWRTGWFYMLCLLAIAAILFALYKYRISHLKKLMGLRTKISQDLHDDVGATLSGIKVFSQLAIDRPDHNTEYLHKISNYSDEMLHRLGDIVWSVKSENDSFEQLVGKLRSYAVTLTTAKNIQLQFDVDPDFKNNILDPGLRRNIYLITKEAINNAIKYAECSYIGVMLKRKTGGAELIIEDNGKGFDKNAETEGNGLSNMRKRTEEIHGKFMIETVPGKGTSIRVLFNFT